MVKYHVVYSRAALSELDDAYSWGVAFWGKEQAESWLDDVESTIESRLSTQPLSCPIVPESQRVKHELRHLIYDRYRIIFRIQTKQVTVLRVTGPFNSRSRDPFFD